EKCFRDEHFREPRDSQRRFIRKRSSRRCLSCCRTIRNGLLHRRQSGSGRSKPPVDALGVERLCGAGRCGARIYWGGGFSALVAGPFYEKNVGGTFSMIYVQTSKNVAACTSSGDGAE